MLIDAGDNDQGTKVQSYLEYLGISSLDYLVLTHPDADHIGGADVVIYKFDCNTILMPERKADTRTYDDVIQAMKPKITQLFTRKWVTIMPLENLPLRFSLLQEIMKTAMTVLLSCA